MKLNSMNLRQRTPQLTPYLLRSHSQTPIARVPVYTHCVQGRAGQKITRQTPINITCSFHSIHNSAQKLSLAHSGNKPTGSITNSEAPKPNPKPKRESSPIQLWPFLAILLGGTFLFNQLLKTRAGTQPPKEGAQIASGPLTISK